MRLHPCMTTSYGVPVRQARTLPTQLVCSCASGFFQIPPCDGHPCLRLTIPTAKFVVVFHHLVIAHAGHTMHNKTALPGSLFDIEIRFFVEMFGNVQNQKRLDELCKHFGDGDWIESKDQADEGIRLIQTGNIGNGEYTDKGDKARFISEDTFTRLGCTEVFPGDILISRLPDPIGRACIVPEMPKSITAVDCTIVRLKDCMLPSFFVNYTKTPAYTEQIASFTTGSTRKRISRANLGSITVPVPDINEQKHFVQLVAQSDRAKKALQQSLEEARALQKKIVEDNFIAQRKDA